MRRDRPVGGVVMEKMNNRYQSNEDLNTFRLTPMKRMYYALGDFGYNFMYYWLSTYLLYGYDWDSGCHGIRHDAGSEDF